jgi:hypothetical protein
MIQKADIEQATRFFELVCDAPICFRRVSIPAGVIVREDKPGRARQQEESENIVRINGALIRSAVNNLRSDDFICIIKGQYYDML